MLNCAAERLGEIPSSLRAAPPAWLGPNALMPAASRSSTMPAASGVSGPTTTKSTALRLQKSITAAWSAISSATHSASRAMPALPGAHHSFVSSGDAAIFHASACSRPPEPSRRMFMNGARCGVSRPSRSHESPCESIPAFRGARSTSPESISCREYDSGPAPSGASRNDVLTSLLPPPDAAMISCNVATWRAKAPRPAAVAVTVVCGFLPTKALSTAT